MQVEVDMKCIETEFGGVTFPVFKKMLLFTMAKFPFQPMDLVHGGFKK